MTTQKEFHELLQVIENLLEKHKDFTSYEDSEYGECIRKSAAFVPLAIDQIKRLEWALRLSKSFILSRLDCRDCDGKTTLEQIQKELVE